MRRYRFHHRRNPTTPRIYVANLAAYNAGRMKGKWIEPSTDADELAEQVAEAIGGNVDRDEWAFHDYDAFPNMGETPSLEDVAAMAELLEEHPYGIVKAAMDIVGDDVDAIKKLLDEGYGVYESKKDYAEELIENMGGVDQLDRNTLERHFDYDSFTREIFDETPSTRVDGLGLVVFNAR